MSKLSSTREALLAELIGDVSQLLDRAAALIPTLEEASLDVSLARGDLSDQIQAFEAKMAALSNHVRRHAANDVALQLKAIGERILERHREAMAEAAGSLFRTHMDSTLRALVMPLQTLVARIDRPWRGWMMHAATATAASIMASTLTLVLLTR